MDSEPDLLKRLEKAREGLQEDRELYLAELCYRASEEIRSLQVALEDEEAAHAETIRIAEYRHKKHNQELQKLNNGGLLDLLNDYRRKVDELNEMLK